MDSFDFFLLGVVLVVAGAVFGIAFLSTEFNTAFVLALICQWAGIASLFWSYYTS